MKLITEALVGMVITKIDESIIYYVNGIFDVLGITNEWLFAKCSPMNIDYRGTN